MKDQIIVVLDALMSSKDKESNFDSYSRMVDNN